MRKSVFRIVARKADGELHVRDFSSLEEIGEFHDQVGVDDCSVHHDLRGLPMFKGLIGPMAEGAHVVRYETPEVFEMLTKEWIAATPVRRREQQAKRNM